MRSRLCQQRSAGRNYKIIVKQIERPETKKSGLKVVTLIATPNPVSQVLW
jgi:hypothetical protein